MFKAIPAKERKLEHDYKCADGTIILFDMHHHLPVNHVYLGYVDSLADRIDITIVIEKHRPDLHRKYLSELQEHVDSWGSDEDEREFQAGKERNWA